MNEWDKGGGRSRYIGGGSPDREWMSRDPLLLLFSEEEPTQPKMGRSPKFSVSEPQHFVGMYQELADFYHDIDRAALEHFVAGLINVLERSANTYGECSQDDPQKRYQYRKGSPGLPDLIVVWSVKIFAVTLEWIGRADVATRDH